jgi:hydroxypyruvate isomerase
MPNRFNLKYAPHIGSFVNTAGKDPIDQIKYMADLGFTALEDSGFKADYIPFDATKMGIGMCNQPNSVLDKIGSTMDKLGMEMGTFVVTPHTWPPIDIVTSGKPELQKIFIEKYKNGLEVAKRINAKFVTVTLDCYDRSLPIEMQTANAIDALKKLCEYYEGSGVTMVLEPLSDHHELFLRTASQCYLISRAVGSDNCKILFDMYHLQKNEGRLIHHIDMVWDEIGYFQIGNEPGRTEPGTGEIDYKNIFKHIYQKSKADNKDFIFGMEHFNSKEGVEGEKALLKAYLKADNFLTD